MESKIDLKGLHESVKPIRFLTALLFFCLSFALQVGSCENAYFKMDNVLIDDRRIHVDFSQSVAKNYQWKRNDGK